MSGLEIIGLALGAFPIALLALEKHEEVARRFNMFTSIRIEHKHWVDDLRLYEITYARHLKQLLLPLIFDDDKVEELLSDPLGDAWRDKRVEPLLRKRLRDAYELYFAYIEGVGQVMDEINEHLALTSAPIQDKLKSGTLLKGKYRVKAALNRDSRAFQWYRLKFSNTQSLRVGLFGRLRDYLDKMEKLLASGDEESRMVQQRNLAVQKTATDSSICSFWLTAKKLFKALASSWGCRCQQHDARLILQHRDTRQSDFDITLVKCEASHWELHRTRISGSDDKSHSVVIETGGEKRDSGQLRPSHTEKTPLKSSLRIKGKQKAAVRFSGGPTLVEICEVETVETVVTLRPSLPIGNLCESFSGPEGACCGFLEEGDTRYTLYSVSRYTVSRYDSTTLETILRREGYSVPSRAKRLALSLTLASSFMQLLDSPWIDKPLSKTEVLFLQDPAAESGYRLDQPQLVKSLLPSPGDDQQKPAAAKIGRWYKHGLEQLGILLLELCFGETLEQQPCRTRWPAAGTEAEKAGFDFLAAKEWRDHVNEEAGLDYADAVDWCLWGYQSSPPDTWRQDMLRRVIQPLQRCHGYLNGGSQW